MRELQATAYDSKIYKDENLLYKNKLIEPVTLKKNLTYMWGKDSDMFPLHTLTEGQGALKSVKPKLLNDTQYSWDVMGRMKNTSKIVGLANASLTKPGLGIQPFEAIFEDNWIHAQYGAFTPDGMYQVRVNSEPVQIGPNRWTAWLVLQTTDPTAYITLDNFIPGKAWAQTATSVAASKSDGTTSNAMTPGKWTNQFSFFRYSQQIAGNIANKVTNIQFDLEGGGTTNMWMPFQMKQFEMHIRQMNEERLWFDEYNRNAQGEITTKDPETGEPIPHGAGVKATLKAVNNYDTFSILTKAKLDSTIKAAFDNRVDDTPMEIVLYTGKGGAEMFNDAITTDATSKGYYQALGENVIYSGGDYLSYGKYFRQYKTIDGKIITVKTCNLFDHGSRAEMQRLNGDMYNGYPFDSYTLVFLDQSKTGDGERNITMVAEEGREYITGIYKGMSPLPAVWGSLPSSSVSMLGTRKDIAAYEVMGSAGIAITNPHTSFWLDFAH